MSWKLLILDMGYNPADVLAFARLSGDLFARKDATLSPAEYFNLWRGMEQVGGADEPPLKLGQAISVEAFDPALFACLCSPDLNTALQRLAQYKRLVGPLTMDVDITSKGTKVRQSKQINVSSLFDSVRLNDVVPLAVKGIAHNIDAFHFFVAYLATSRIFPAIQSTLDFEPLGCRRLGDQVNYCFVIY